jgi:hypothetical protein
MSNARPQKPSLKDLVNKLKTPPQEPSAALPSKVTTSAANKQMSGVQKVAYYISIFHLFTAGLLLLVSIVLILVGSSKKNLPGAVTYAIGMALLIFSAIVIPVSILFNFLVRNNIIFSYVYLVLVISGWISTIVTFAKKKGDITTECKKHDRLAFNEQGQPIIRPEGLAGGCEDSQRCMLLRSGHCVPDCSKITKMEACKKLEHCQTDGNACTRKVAPFASCTAISTPAACVNQGHCEWNGQKCYSSCDKITDMAECAKDPTCSAKGDSCELACPKSHNENDCANPSCKWDPAAGFCTFLSSQCRGKDMVSCNTISTCDWNQTLNACIDRWGPPITHQCRNFYDDTTCAAQPECSWSAKSSLCLGRGKTNEPVVINVPPTNRFGCDTALDAAACANRELCTWDLSVQTCVENASEMAQIKEWLTANNMNEYGDPLGTMYTGGSPAFDAATGVTKDSMLYLIEKHPDRPWIVEQESSMA